MRARGGRLAAVELRPRQFQALATRVLGLAEVLQEGAEVKGMATGFRGLEIFGLQLGCSVQSVG